MRYHTNMDPQLRAGVAMFDQLGLGAQELNAQTLTAIRAARTAAAAIAPAPSNGRVEREDRTVPGAPGDPDVPIRIYRPAKVTAVLPCLYWIHGGGMVMGSVEADDATCESFVEEVGIVVVSVEYRLAPEHPHPAPVEDCYAGLRWVAGAAETLAIDPDRLAVGGASAGGGLAAATVLLARDRGEPVVSFQLLVYPMLDDRDNTPSTLEFSSIPSWSREHNRFGWSALLGTAAGGPAVSPYASPARAEDLSNLPPTLIQVGELEVFRDEDIDYAARLLRAEVPTELHVYPGAFHAAGKVAPDAAVSIRMAQERNEALRRALRGVPGA